MGGNPIERSSSQGCSGPSISTVDARPLIIQRGLLGDKLRPGDEDADYARQTIAMIESAIGSDFGGVFISTLTIQPTGHVVGAGDLPARPCPAPNDLAQNT